MLYEVTCTILGRSNILISNVDNLQDADDWQVLTLSMEPSPTDSEQQTLHITGF